MLPGLALPTSDADRLLHAAGLAPRVGVCAAAARLTARQLQVMIAPASAAAAAAVRVLSHC